MPEVTHIIREGEGITDCCKKTPFELPFTDKIVTLSNKPHQVTCSDYGWAKAVKGPDARES